MEHSKHFQKVKNWYDHGMWDLARLANAVRVKNPWITKEEYEEICGEKYQ